MAAMRFSNENAMAAGRVYTLEGVRFFTSFLTGIKGNISGWIKQFKRPFDGHHAGSPGIQSVQLLLDVVPRYSAI